MILEGIDHKPRFRITAPESQPHCRCVCGLHWPLPPLRRAATSTRSSTRAFKVKASSRRRWRVVCTLPLQFRIWPYLATQHKKTMTALARRAAAALLAPREVGAARARAAGAAGRGGRRILRLYHYGISPLHGLTCAGGGWGPHRAHVLSWPRFGIGTDPPLCPWSRRWVPSAWEGLARQSRLYG